jgi:hypothetical protein
MKQRTDRRVPLAQRNAPQVGIFITRNFLRRGLFCPLNSKLNGEGN